MQEIKDIIEAALFMSPGIVSLTDLARVCKSNVAEVRVVLNELIHDYAERDSALEIRDEEKGFRMTVRKELEDTVMHLASSPEFHKGIMKTLAYIAYKQPVKQNEVIKFRNTKAYDHIQLLLEKGFIRREKTDKTFTIYTTKKFYQYFGSSMKKDAAQEAPETAESADSEAKEEQQGETERQEAGL